MTWIWLEQNRSNTDIFSIVTKVSKFRGILYGNRPFLFISVYSLKTDQYINPANILVLVDLAINSLKTKCEFVVVVDIATMWHEYWDSS